MNSPPPSRNHEAVILLHGLARTNRSMLPVEQALIKAGYNTLNYNYPSREQPIEMLAQQYIGEALAQCRLRYQPSRIHFVTHSMGGILIRYYLSQQGLAELGRVVMLAPPNAGSELVDRLGGFQLFDIINGPAGRQLGTSAGSLPRSLGPAHYELGIIAGSKNLNPLSALFIAGTNDGKVSIESARLEGMGDFIVLPFGHTFMMNRAAVIAQILNFLQLGHFVHAHSGGPEVATK